jgi:hypothetical protein
MSRGTSQTQTSDVDDGDGLSLSADGPTGILMQVSSSGAAPAPELSLYLAEVAIGMNQPLGTGSKVCLVNAPECLPVSGTLSVTTFVTDCATSGACALTMTGTLDAAATWSGGTIHLSLSIAQTETLESQPCVEDHAPSATEGS